MNKNDIGEISGAGRPGDPETVNLLVFDMLSSSEFFKIPQLFLHVVQRTSQNVVAFAGSAAGQGVFAAIDVGRSPNALSNRSKFDSGRMRWRKGHGVLDPGVGLLTRSSRKLALGVGCRWVGGERDDESLPGIAGILVFALAILNFTQKKENRPGFIARELRGSCGVGFRVRQA